MKLIYGNYYCTEDGRVFSLREIKPQKSNGYYRVWVCQNGTQKQTKIHRLVWEYFNGPIPKGMQINHINGITTDNSIANLELCTQSENMRHAYKLGLVKNLRRKPYQVKNLDTGKTFNSIRAAALAYGLHPSTLNNMFRYNQKTCGGYKWELIGE